MKLKPFIDLNKFKKSLKEQKNTFVIFGIGYLIYVLFRLSRGEFDFILTDLDFIEKLPFISWERPVYKLKRNFIFFTDLFCFCKEMIAKIVDQNSRKV